MKGTLVLIIGAILLNGCIQLENTYPRYTQKSFTKVSGDVSVGFSGTLFKTWNVSSVSGMSTVYGNTYNNGFQTANVYTVGSGYTEQRSNYECEPLRDQMEERGFITRAQNPKYMIDVSEHERTQSLEAGVPIYLLSLTFADRTDMEFKYRLKVYETSSGKLLYSKVVPFCGYVTNFRLIPIFWCTSWPGEISYYEGWGREIADKAADFLISHEKKLNAGRK